MGRRQPDQSCCRFQVERHQQRGRGDEEKKGCAETGSENNPNRSTALVVTGVRPIAWSGNPRSEAALPLRNGRGSAADLGVSSTSRVRLDEVRIAKRWDGDSRTSAWRDSRLNRAEIPPG